MTYIFYREHSFYPLELPDDERARLDAENNAGTIRVTRIESGQETEVWHVFVKPKVRLKHRLKLTVLRRDDIPGFGAWMACKCGGECPHQNTILLNLEAIFGDGTEYEDGTKPEFTKAERKELLLTTLMHEFGHALEQYLKLEFNEERLEKIIDSFRAQPGLEQKL